jgi:type VI protein secretion system component VasK
MRPRPLIVIAVVAGVCILAVFISPAVHLEKTALLAENAAYLTMLALIAAGTVFLMTTPRGCSCPELWIEATRHQKKVPETVRELLCVQLC